MKFVMKDVLILLKLTASIDGWMNGWMDRFQVHFVSGRLTFGNCEKRFTLGAVA